MNVSNGEISSTNERITPDIDTLLHETEHISTGTWVGCVAKIREEEYFGVAVEGTSKIVAVFGLVGAGDEAESIANATAFQYFPVLRDELIRERICDKEDLDRAHKHLAKIRQGMHALYLRHIALRTAAKRYVDEWESDLPKGWSLDELLQSLQLEHEIPSENVRIDPDGECTYRENIEDWVTGVGQWPIPAEMPKNRVQLNTLLDQVYRKGNQDAHAVIACIAARVADNRNEYKDAFIEVRSALAGVVGEKSPDTLLLMQGIIKLADIPEHDKQLALDAISALLNTNDLHARMQPARGSSCH